MSASPPASTARSMSLMWAARMASVEPNSARNCDSFSAGPAGDFGEADLLERLLGEQRHQRVDRLVAVGGAARRHGLGLRAALFFGLAGHGGLLRIIRVALI